jgi:hypothetical protein
MLGWIYKLIGKNLANKIGLKETNMADEPVVSIPWYKSKTILTAIVTVIIGAIQPISTAFGHPIAIPEWVLSLLVGLGLYTARTATTDIK